jgi:hypothetical protein
MTNIEDVPMVDCKNCGRRFGTVICPKCTQELERKATLQELEERVPEYFDVKREMALASEERGELEAILKRHQCFLRGCIYGHELNDYCICCGEKRPKNHNYGRSINES